MTRKNITKGTLPKDTGSATVFSATASHQPATNEFGFTPPKEDPFFAVPSLVVDGPDAGEITAQVSDNFSLD